MKTNTVAIALVALATMASALAAAIPPPPRPTALKMRVFLPPLEGQQYFRTSTEVDVATTPGAEISVPVTQPQPDAPNLPAGTATLTYLAGDRVQVTPSTATDAAFEVALDLAKLVRWDTDPLANTAPVKYSADPKISWASVSVRGVVAPGGPVWPGRRCAAAHENLVPVPWPHELRYHYYRQGVPHDTYTFLAGEAAVLPGGLAVTMPGENGATREVDGLTFTLTLEGDRGRIDVSDGSTFALQKSEAYRTDEKHHAPQVYVERRRWVADLPRHVPFRAAHLVSADQGPSELLVEWGEYPHPPRVRVTLSKMEGYGLTARVAEVFASPRGASWELEATLDEYPKTEVSGRGVLGKEALVEEVELALGERRVVAAEYVAKFRSIATQTDRVVDGEVLLGLVYTMTGHLRIGRLVPSLDPDDSNYDALTRTEPWRAGRSQSDELFFNAEYVYDYRMCWDVEAGRIVGEGPQPLQSGVRMWSGVLGGEREAEEAVLVSAANLVVEYLD